MKIFLFLFALATASAMAACSAAGTVTAIHASPARIASVRTFASGNTFYVAGTIRRPSGHTIPPGSHIDIVLLDHAGRVMAIEQDRILPSHPHQERRRLGRYSFAVGFPRSAGRAARHITVTYHAARHS